MMEIVEKKIDELKPWDKNPRINDHAVDAVAKSISAFGFNVPILCDQNLTIIAGHTRWKAAKKLGLSSIPVIVRELTEEQRKAFAIADNKTAEIADWDWPQLKNIALELKQEDFDLSSLGFTEEELRRILDPGQAEDEVPCLKAASSIRRGDMFQLGRHRILCGDAGNERDWQRVLSEKTADLVVTSPPRFNNLGLGNWNTIGDYLHDIESAIFNLATKLSPGGIAHWNIGNPSNLKTNLVAKQAQFFELAGLQYLELLSLSRPFAAFPTKRNYQIWRNGYYYPAHQCNPIWVYQKPGKMPKMTPEGRKYMTSTTPTSGRYPISPIKWRNSDILVSLRSNCRSGPYKPILAREVSFLIHLPAQELHLSRQRKLDTKERLS